MAKTKPLLPAGWELEEQLWKAGYALTAGVDEAGRGALAGPVVAAIVILPYDAGAPFRDSKTLTARQREHLVEQVKRQAFAWATGTASAAEVDAVNVLQATHLAARRALHDVQRQLAPQALVTDYLKLAFHGPVTAVPRGDQRSAQVAAASILAKTTRDSIMLELDTRYPQYGFARHKGYGAREHLQALAQHGPCEIHRFSFGPVTQGRLFS